MSSDHRSLDPPNLNDQSDVDLFHALKRGKTEALGVLYDRHADLVYGLAFRLLKNAEEAEDLTQDIFLTLYQKDTYNPSRGALASFLRTMTHSRAVDRLRGRGVQFRFLNRWNRSVQAHSGEKNPLQKAVQSENATAVQQALANLSDSERQVLEIAYYEGLTQKAIAEQLNLPLGTVKSRSRQGLKKLKRALDSWI